MPITIDCPRCYTSLSVPEKLAGQYTFCPRCQGRLWVPPDASGSARSAAGGRAATATAPAASAIATMPPNPAAPPVPPAVAVDPMAPVKMPSAAGGTAPPVATKLPPAPPLPGPVAGPSAAVQAPPAVAQPPAPSSRRVAQFITADVAQSQLTLAEDGKLPELHLNVDDTGPRKRKVFSGGSSWATIALVAASLLATVAMILIDTKPAGRTTHSSDAYDIIRGRYFGEEGVEIRPYQVLLRQALQAHERRDFKAEKEQYRKVLSMLRDENLHPHGRNLTGQIDNATDRSLPSDKDLEEVLSTLLGER